VRQSRVIACNARLWPLHELHQNIAGLEKRSRHQTATGLRIPLVARVADDLVAVVAEPLAGVSAPHD